MKRHEVLKALDRIYEMSDAEMRINQDWIRAVALAAYGLIKQRHRQQKRGGGHNANS